MQKINIGFVIDDKYVKYTSVVIASILKNSKSSFVFHIVNDGSISEKNKKKLDKLKKYGKFEIKYYPQNKALHHEQRSDTRSDIPMVTNYRMMISSILSDIDKIIFMDADLILEGDIKELWEINIDDYYIACCDSPKSAFQDYQQKIDIPDEYYYCNTGVMLVNLKKWRDNDIEQKLFEKEKEYRGIYKFYDQCIFNIALYDKILYIDQKFNFRPGIWNSKEDLEKFENKNVPPLVIHWASPHKPWNNKNVRYFKNYKKYAKLTCFFKEIFENLVDLDKNSFLQNIFSVRNKYAGTKKHKVLTILGIKIKFKK